MLKLLLAIFSQKYQSHQCLFVIATLSTVCFAYSFTTCALVAGNLEAYLRISSKLKLATVEDEYTVNLNLSSKSQQVTGETDVGGQVKTG